MPAVRAGFAATPRYRPQQPWQCLYRQGRYDRAIRDYDQSIKIDPKNAKAFNNRGVAYQKKGEHDRAIEDFDEAIKLILATPARSPTAPKAIATRAITNARPGTTTRRSGCNPRRTLVWNGRCWTRALAGPLQAALADCNEALRLQPNVAATWDSRGFTYLKMAQWDLPSPIIVRRCDWIRGWQFALWAWFRQAQEGRHDRWRCRHCGGKGYRAEYHRGIRALRRAVTACRGVTTAERDLTINRQVR